MGLGKWTVEFGNYRLNRAERLLIGPEGPVELSARSFDILAMLLEKPDEVIGKTELFDTVWPGLVVEENTLQVHISALRKTAARRDDHDGAWSRLQICRPQALRGCSRISGEAQSRPSPFFPSTI